ncbi:hypothetical protein AK830_g7414 [Neonectria ditissima]|uniref:2EXR domain-containing protein n=1 Tax=Neonectria ditissima TaxID=78410 RepID=A0A0P7AMW2_9HYPO|nr:hypothetical protein AK830_g7414 [Neonectria ditissima]
MATSLPQFGRFPAEIRRLIWDATLPVDDEPALRLFDWRWYLQFVNANRMMSKVNNVDHRSYVQVAMPAAIFVCREARDAVDRWRIKRGLTMRLRHETQGHILVREWDRSRDPVYVPLDAWDEFKCFRGDWLEGAAEGGVEELGASIEHLALPAFTAYFSIPTLAELLEWMPNLRGLHVVWGELPAARASEVQPRWELKAEDGEMVKMCVRDPVGGGLMLERAEELAGYDEDMEEQWAIREVPEQFVDEETGGFGLDMRHVRLKKSSR